MIHSSQFRRYLASLLLLGLALCAAPSAHAEGTAQVGTSQPLRAGTVLGVDILNAAQETIRWTGSGTVAVKGPDGSSLGNLNSGATFVPNKGNGAYRLTVARDQTIGSTWDVTVLNATDSGGRLFSWNWQFNAGSYAQSAGTNASFYALVHSGTWENTQVIELKLAGLAGYIYDINANSTGVVGVNAGRSVPESGNSTVPVHQIYLQIPSVANFESATPGVSGLNYVGGVDRDVNNNPIEPCEQILPGASRGYFYFTSQTTGTYHLQCDLNHDGTFEEGPTNDLFLVGTVAIGTNTVSWDGRHNGTPIASGDYSCRVRITIGEFHYVGRDIETSYPGMRIFRVNEDGSRSGLKMYWNDSLVSAGDIKMPNNQYSKHTSQGEVDSGTYATSAVANTNARAWGNFSGNGKGNATYLDTYVWLSDASSSTIHVSAADDTDSDDDGLTDFEEECLVGSDAENPDTDDDGQPDGAQYAIPESSIFSGLESNGRLSTALARRSIRKLRMSFDPRPVGVSASALTVEGGLTEWFPASLRDADSTLATPADLLAVTNAVEVAGVDYQGPGGQRVAGALLVATAGELYEHQKGVCDRVKGARLVDVQPVRMNGVQVFQSTTSDPSDGRLEYSVTISIVDDAENNVWTPSALWVKEQAPEVSEGARVLTLQSWASTPELAHELAESILERIGSEQTIAWPTPAPIIDDEDYVANTIAPAPLVDAQEPTVLVQQVSTLGGATALHMRRQSGAGTVTLRVVALAENGKDEIIETYPVDLQASAIDVPLDLNPFLDATIDVLDNDVVVDRVWITDGAWAPFDAMIWNGDTSTDHFSRTDCTVRDLASSAEGKAWKAGSESSVHLSGCALTKAAGGGNGLSRHMTRPLTVGTFGSAAYFIKTSSAYQICFEGSNARECVEMPAAPEGKYEAVPTTAFSTVSEAELITFVSDAPKATRMEVSSLTLLEQDADTRPTLPSGLTCTTRPSGTTSSTNGAFALLIAAMLLMRRRR